MRRIESRTYWVTLIVTGLLGCTPHTQRASAGAQPVSTASNPATATFEPIAAVLRHPRCLNCHTVSDYPRQGNDRHPHRFLVARGLDDRGAAGERCNECHQGQNQDNGVPGAPGWRLAPSQMAWESTPGTALSPSALCHRLLDRSHNGNRDLSSLEQHFETEPLVQWAWSPGHSVEGTARERPPLTYDEFLRAFLAWKAAGASCPNE